MKFNNEPPRRGWAICHRWNRDFVDDARARALYVICDEIIQRRDIQNSRRYSSSNTRHLYPPLHLIPMEVRGVRGAHTATKQRVGDYAFARNARLNDGPRIIRLPAQTPEISTGANQTRHYTRRRYDTDSSRLSIVPFRRRRKLPATCVPPRRISQNRECDARDARGVSRVFRERTAEVAFVSCLLSPSRYYGHLYYILRCQISQLLYVKVIDPKNDVLHILGGENISFLSCKFLDISLCF